MKFLLFASLLVSCAVAAQRDWSIAADGSASFRSIQAAVDALPADVTEPVTIHLKPGVYRGHVKIAANKPPLILEGSDAATTIITDDKNVYSLDASGKKLSTRDSATVLVEGDGFTARNLTFENTAGNNGQALALFISGDRAAFTNCRFLGWQDTVRVEKARQYFRGCYFQGHCDFIYGNATAFFEDCHIHCLDGGYITAASTPEDHPYGFVFLRCHVTTGPGVKRTFLGRPWRPFASVTFIHTELSAAVHPAGWDNWRDPSKEKTARFAEYQSTGPGANPSTRAAWSRQLAKEDAEAITPEAVLGMPDLASLRKEGRWPDPDTASASPSRGLRIVLAGDSTVTDDGGWGRGFAGCLQGDAVCINLARAGRSSKSFRDAGEWQKVIAAKPDYLLIQFGHNDMPGKGPERETDPATTYQENMKRFINEARAAGARPVLVTSMTRRHFREGRIESDLLAYVDAVKQVAVETKTPVIDLHESSIRFFNQAGPDACATLSPVDGKTGGVDATHLNAKGGEAVGKLVAAGLAESVPALKPFLKP